MRGRGRSALRWVCTLGAGATTGLALVCLVAPCLWGSRGGVEVVISGGQFGVVWGTSPKSVVPGWRRDRNANGSGWAGSLQVQVGIAPRWVIVPLWVRLLIFGAPLPFLWRRDRRSRPGECAGCGYSLESLHASPDPERRFGWVVRCPECGGTIPASPSD